MSRRLDQQPDETLLDTVRGIESDLRVLKTGAQYAEAKMFEYSSADAYDLSGSLPARSGGLALVASFTVTATSVDGVSFISGFVPQLWIPDTGPLYYDALTGPYFISYNQAVSADPSVIVYWYSIFANTTVAASSFRFKARIYATAPITVTFARTA